MYGYRIEQFLPLKLKLAKLMEPIAIAEQTIFSSFSASTSYYQVVKEPLKFCIAAAFCSGFSVIPSLLALLAPYFIHNQSEAHIFCCDATYKNVDYTAKERWRHLPFLPCRNDKLHHRSAEAQGTMGALWIYHG